MRRWVSRAPVVGAAVPLHGRHLVRQDGAQPSGAAEIAVFLFLLEQLRLMADIGAGLVHRFKIVPGYFHIAIVFQTHRAVTSFGRPRRGGHAWGLLLF